eukprot:TRINITY_DN2380_c0_g1_i2.p1 TRINITY_DN2380_c0_g1~~TRINITY_DN2380_c0_g1_i2.p1  ORF type:complete len:233 (-),score=31.76 TRINITY_DN2380_c0_g1_i2:141-839(-)
MTNKYQGIMDFRQFLCCIPILVRGHVIDKLNLLFEICSQNSTYISKNGFLFYIDAILSSVKYLIDIKQLEEKFQQFKQRILEEFQNDNYISIYTFIQLQSDDFIKEIASYQVVQSDENTILSTSCFFIQDNLAFALSEGDQQLFKQISDFDYEKEQNKKKVNEEQTDLVMQKILQNQSQSQIYSEKQQSLGQSNSIQLQTSIENMQDLGQDKKMSDQKPDQLKPKNLSLIHI